MANSRLIGSLLALGVAFALTAEGCSCGGGGSKSSSPAGPSAGPSSWYSQYRKPTSSNLRAVRAFRDFDGLVKLVVAGEATSIFRSDDAGQTWTQLEHRPVSRGGDVASMDFSGSHLECVGSDSDHPTFGRVWTATNGVLDFATPDVDANMPPAVPAYVSVNVVSATTYYALRSDGVVDQNVSGTVTSLAGLPPGTWNSISFIGTTGTGFAAGDGALVARFDGVKWTAQATPPPPATDPVYNLKKIFFLDANVGFASGDQATILGTVNGGTTWTLQNYFKGGVALRSLHFPVNGPVGTLHGWVVGDAGGIAATVDGGTTWTGQIPPTIENLYDVWFLDDLEGYVVGDHGMVLRTIDGGVTGTSWKRAPPQAVPDSLVNFSAVDFTNSGSMGLVVGQGGLILLSVDGGSTWTPQQNGDTHDLFGVSIPKAGSGTVAYACGANGVVVKTTNLNAAPPTWTAANPGGANTLRAILFPAGDTTGHLCGDGGTLLHTTDGAAWLAPGTAPAPAAANYLTLSSDPGGGNVYVAGTAGISSTSSDSGVTWSNASLPALAGAPPINAFQSPLGGAGGVLFAGAADGNVWKKNGVAAWASTTPFAATVPLGLSFTDPMVGWVVTSPVPFTGGVFTTPDGATTWTRAYVHTKWQLRAVWASPVTPGLVYAVGDTGTILKTTTGGK